MKTKVCLFSVNTISQNSLDRCMRLTYLLTNKHDVGATGVYWSYIPQRTSVEDCAGASFLLHHLHCCHKQALPCPRPPPTHLRSLALAAASLPPVRLPESKHSAVRRNSSFPFVLVAAAGGGGGCRPLNRGNLGSLRLGPIPRLHSRRVPKGSLILGSPSVARRKS